MSDIRSIPGLAMSDPLDFSQSSACEGGGEKATGAGPESAVKTSAPEAT